MAQRTVPSSILGRLPLQYGADGMWLVFGPVRYDLGRKHSGLTITVPKGYTSDLASIHWCLRWVLHSKEIDGPALVHDWLYNTHLVSRPIADAVFHEALLVCGVSRLKVWIMVTAVRIFGGPAYRRGPDSLRARAPEWAHVIFDSPALAGVEKETL
jgi:Protein of unknown function (DUF1353)